MKRSRLRSEKGKKKEEVEKKDATEEKEEKEVKKTGCHTAEIFAMLVHELRQWRLNLISELHIFLLFALFWYLYKNQLLFI